MAGSARYTAVLDANVLYPALLRDLLLSLAHADLYSAKWTAHIRDEWTRTLQKNKPHMAQNIQLAAELMEQAIPDCLVMGYEHLIDGLKLPDPDDRHVLAAAIAGHADAIITWNEKDFPAEVLDPFGIEVQTPDEFVLNQIMLRAPAALTAIKGIYTTNAIESVNMSLRKLTKNRGSFPSDEALTKLFYLALRNISQKWTMPIRDWKAALTRFTIQFGDRISIN